MTKRRKMKKTIILCLVFLLAVTIFSVNNVLNLTFEGLENVKADGSMIKIYYSWDSYAKTDTFILSTDKDPDIKFEYHTRNVVDQIAKSDKLDKLIASRVLENSAEFPIDIVWGFDIPVHINGTTTESVIPASVDLTVSIALNSDLSPTEPSRVYYTIMSGAYLQKVEAPIEFQSAKEIELECSIWETWSPIITGRYEGGRDGATEENRFRIPAAPSFYTQTIYALIKTWVKYKFNSVMNP